MSCLYVSSVFQAHVHLARLYILYMSPGFVYWVLFLQPMLLRAWKFSVFLHVSTTCLNVDMFFYLCLQNLHNMLNASEYVHSLADVHCVELILCVLNCIATDMKYHEFICVFFVHFLFLNAGEGNIRFDCFCFEGILTWYICLPIFVRYFRFPMNSSG